MPHPSSARLMLHSHRTLLDALDFAHIKNVDSADFDDDDIVVAVDKEGDGVWEAKLAKSASTADLRDGYLFACNGPVKQGDVGMGLERKVIPFDTSGAPTAGVPVYIHGTTGGLLTATAPSVIRTVGVVLGSPATPANGGAILFDAKAFGHLAIGAIAAQVVAGEVTKVSLTPGAEAANVIPIAVQGLARTAQYVARVYDADMLLETAANFTLAETGAGAEVSTTAKASLLFTTDSAGAAEISCTDVSGAFAGSVYVEVSPLADPAGGIPSVVGSVVEITFA